MLVESNMAISIKYLLKAGSRNPTLNIKNPLCKDILQSILSKLASNDTNCKKRILITIKKGIAE